MIITHVNLDTTLARNIQLIDLVSIQNINNYLQSNYARKYTKIINDSFFGPISIVMQFTGIDKDGSVVAMIHITSETLSSKQYASIIYRSEFLEKLYAILIEFIDYLNSEIDFVHPSNINFSFTENNLTCLNLCEQKQIPEFTKFKIYINEFVYKDLSENSSVY